MINIEHLVYGTFAFTQGFTLVSASPGLPRPLSSKIVEVCKAWGEVHSPEFKHALYHVPLLLTDEDYAWISGELRSIADSACQGRIVKPGAASRNQATWSTFSSGRIEQVT